MALNSPKVGQKRKKGRWPAAPALTPSGLLHPSRWLLKLVRPSGVFWCSDTKLGQSVTLGAGTPNPKPSLLPSASHTWLDSAILQCTFTKDHIGFQGETGLKSSQSGKAGCCTDIPAGGPQAGSALTPSLSYFSCDTGEITTHLVMTISGSMTYGNGCSIALSI